MAVLDQPFAATDGLEGVLPAGGDRRRDRDRGSGHERAELRSVRALRGQDERACGDRRVATDCSDPGDRGRPGACDPERQRRAGEDHFRATVRAVCGAAPATRVQHEVAAPARFVDPIDGELRDPIRQRHRCAKGHVAKARLLVRIEPERRLGRGRARDDLAEVDLEPGRGAGRGVNGSECVAIDRAITRCPSRDTRAAWLRTVSSAFGPAAGPETSRLMPGAAGSTSMSSTTCGPAVVVHRP